MFVFIFGNWDFVIGPELTPHPASATQSRTGRHQPITSHLTAWLTARSIFIGRSLVCQNVAAFALLFFAVGLCQNDRKENPTKNTSCLSSSHFLEPLGPVSLPLLKMWHLHLLVGVLSRDRSNDYWGFGSTIVCARTQLKPTQVQFCFEMLVFIRLIWFQTFQNLKKKSEESSWVHHFDVIAQTRLPENGRSVQDHWTQCFFLETIISECYIPRNSACVKKDMKCSFSSDCAQKYKISLHTSSVAINEQSILLRVRCPMKAFHQTEK